MKTEGTTGAEAPATSPLADLEASLEKLGSQPIATDVDGLREEIAAFKEKVLLLLRSNLNENPKRSTMYKALEMLAVRNEALALMLEKKRVADAVAKHASEHGLEEFDCPICLDTVIRITDDSILYFSCCGNGLCRSCHKEMKAKGKITSCPLCRARKPQAPDSSHTAH